MTLKRLILSILTILAVSFVVGDLLTSWSQPQFQSRLELYQTDLLLQASEWDHPIAQAVLKNQQPLQTALGNYQETVALVDGAIATAQSQSLENRSPENTDSLQKSLTQQRILKDELLLRIGLLQAEQGDNETALDTWQQLSAPMSTPSGSTSPSPRSQLPAALTALWRQPPGDLSQVEPVLQQQLRGWFQNRALFRLYQRQPRSQALETLQTMEQQAAKVAFQKWAIVAVMPALSVLVGLGLLIFLTVQRVLQGKKALLAGTNQVTWKVPWDGEIVWQVLIFGFFFLGQFLIAQVLLPLTIGAMGVDPATLKVRDKAWLSLSTYVFMAAGSLGVLYGSIKPWLPLSSEWFRFRWRGQWVAWGVGGFFVAYPLVVAVSWINQQIWQGKGGSNPLLPIALENQDSLATLLFFLTAVVAAPLFEETLFRGFLLPSLTKYLSTWQAILASSLLFAIVHLNLSEVLPLMTLGAVLGFVYTRSQNLLASILLHGLWNGSTLLTLFLIGNRAT